MPEELEQQGLFVARHAAPRRERESRGNGSARSVVMMLQIGLVTKMATLNKRDIKQSRVRQIRNRLIRIQQIYKQNHQRKLNLTIKSSIHETFCKFYFKLVDRIVQLTKSIKSVCPRIFSAQNLGHIKEYISGWM